MGEEWVGGKQQAQHCGGFLLQITSPRRRREQSLFLKQLAGMARKHEVGVMRYFIWISVGKHNSINTGRFIAPAGVFSWVRRQMSPYLKKGFHLLNSSMGTQIGFWLPVFAMAMVVPLGVREVGEPQAQSWVRHKLYQHLFSGSLRRGR